MNLLYRSTNVYVLYCIFALLALYYRVCALQYLCTTASVRRCICELLDLCTTVSVHHCICALLICALLYL